MYLENWQEFKKAAEKVYLANPDRVSLSNMRVRDHAWFKMTPKFLRIIFPFKKIQIAHQILPNFNRNPLVTDSLLQVRCVMKYSHDGNQVDLKVTDDIVCFQFKTDLFNEYKQVEGFVGELMTQMVSK